MPTYVYKCDSCAAQFEKLQSFKDAPLQTCPACEGAVRRVFQPVGIVFKGSGWYITDSRKSSSAATGTEGAKTEPAKPETSTAEPAAKSDSTSKPETTSTANTSASTAASA